MANRLTDNRAQLEAALNAKIARGLEAVGITAEAYAKGLCPVDTGRLRNSITHEVRGNTVYIMTNVEYAPYVEMGTSKTTPQPFLRPAIQDHADEYKSILENAIRNA